MLLFTMSPLYNTCRLKLYLEQPALHTLQLAAPPGSILGWTLCGFHRDMPARGKCLGKGGGGARGAYYGG